MADYDINQANDYIADDGSSSSGGGSLPPSAVGKGGLSAMDAAIRSSGGGGLSAGGAGMPINPMIAMMAPHLMSTMSDEDQKQLRDTLYSRIRNPEQMQGAADSRRGALEQLQSALQMPENNFSGLQMIAHGMARNTHPWDVGYGFREGVGDAMDAQLARTKLAREAAIQSALAQQQFQTGEEGIATKMEDNALTNLRNLAKPLAAKGGMGGMGGVRFKNVPGKGFIDTWDLDPNTGKLNDSAVLFPDGKVLAEAMKKAMDIATKETTDTQNNLNFSNDAERTNYIRQKAESYLPLLLPQMNQAKAMTAPGVIDPNASTQSGAPAPAAPGAASAAPGKQALPAGMSATAASDGSRYLILNDELMQEKDPKNQAAIKAEMSRLPAAERAAGQAALAAGTVVKADGTIVPPPSGAPGPLSAAALTPPVNKDPNGSMRIDGPEVQQGRIKANQEMASSMQKLYDGLQTDAANGRDTVSLVKDLKQLQFTPGSFAKFKQMIGNGASAFDVAASLAKDAGNTTLADKLIQEKVNARMTREHGTQTDSDEVRFRKQFASISDPKMAYDYMLSHMNEQGLKAQDMAQRATDLFNKQGSLTGLDNVLKQRNEEYGGMMKRYGSGGGFVGRSQFISGIVNDPNNLKAYGGDKAKLQQRAEKEWNNLGGQ